jgi:hypothetical protein
LRLPKNLLSFLDTLGWNQSTMVDCQPVEAKENLNNLLQTQRFPKVTNSKKL